MVRHSALAAFAIALLLTGCAGAGAPAPSPSGTTTPVPGGGDTPSEQADELDPRAPKCDPAHAADFAIVPTALPEHWPADVPVINGPCFGAFELADSTGGYALEVSVALAGVGVDFDDFQPWRAANSWLADAGMEPVFVDDETAGGRESLYREGLVTAASGDEFYHYELRLSAVETDDGYVVIQYLLNLLNV